MSANPASDRPVPADIRREFQAVIQDAIDRAESVLPMLSRAANREAAIAGLCELLSCTEMQARAVLDLRWGDLVARSAR